MDWSFFTNRLNALLISSLLISFFASCEAEMDWENTFSSSSSISALNDTLLVAEDSSNNLGTLSATDLKSLPMTFSIVSGASLGTVTLLDPVAGTYTYTPNPNAYGSDQFTFQATNGEDVGFGTVFVTITNLQDSPTALNDLFSTNEDVTYNGTLSGSDPDPDALTFSIVTNGT